MNKNVKENINILKHQAEKIDNRYKAMIDICNDTIKIAEELQFNIQELEKEIKIGNIW